MYVAEMPRPGRDRPEIPDGYGVPRTDHGVLEWSAVEKRLEESHHYWMATTRPNGKPHVVSGAAPRLPAAVTVEALETGSSTAKFGPAPGLEHRIAAAPLTLEDGTTVVVIAGQSTEFVEQQLTGSALSYGRPRSSRWSRRRSPPGS